MIETPISFLQVDVPAAGAVLPPGRHALQGWVMPKLNGSFSDVRARIGCRIHPGVLGVLRKDLAQHFQTGRAREPAGFHIQVELEAGAASVVIEALQIEGVWQWVGSLDLRVDASLPRVDLPLPIGPVRWREFGQLLRRMLIADAPGRTPAQLAGEIVAAVPFPRDLLRPKPPYSGALREPGAAAAAPDGRLEIEGHVFGAARIVGVLATVDLDVWQPLRYGEPTPAVAAFHPRQPGAAACGFSGSVYVPAQLPNPIALRIYAELEDGSRELCHAARIWRSTAEEETRPFSSRFAGQFDACVHALRRAIAARQLALVTGRAYELEVSRLRDALGKMSSGTPMKEAPIAPAQDVARITPESSESLRAAWGMRTGQTLVVAIDSTNNRAGFHTFVRAVALLHRRYPEIARETCFALARPDGPAADAALSALLDELGPSAPLAAAQAMDAATLCAVADIVVLPACACASESIRAMARLSEVPVIATGGAGRHREDEAVPDAAVVPAGDTAALAESMARWLISPMLRQDIAGSQRRGQAI